MVDALALCSLEPLSRREKDRRFEACMAAFIAARKETKSANSRAFFSVQSTLSIWPINVPAVALPFPQEPVYFSPQTLKRFHSRGVGYAVQDRDKAGFPARERLVPRVVRVASRQPPKLLCDHRSFQAAWRGGFASEIAPRFGNEGGADDLRRQSSRGSYSPPAPLWTARGVGCRSVFTSPLNALGKV
jgi:hypothetical protein